MSKEIFPFSTLTDALGELVFPRSPEPQETQSSEFIAFLKERRSDALRSVIVEAARHAASDLAAALVLIAGLFELLRRYRADDAIEAAQRRLLIKALKAWLVNVGARLSARRSAALFRDFRDAVLKINFDQDLFALVRHRRGDALLLYAIASNLAEQIHSPEGPYDLGRSDEAEADTTRRRALRAIVGHFWRSLMVETVVERLTERSPRETEDEDATPAPLEGGGMSVATAALERVKRRRMAQPPAPPQAEWQEAKPRYEPGIAASAGGLEKTILFQGLSLRPPRDEAGAMVNQYRILTRPIPLIPLPSPQEVGRRLSQAFPWMPDAVAHIETALTLAKRLAIKHFQLSPILLSGPPGVGKTAFAAGVAEAAGVPAHNFQAGGSSDAYHFQGAPPTFRGAAPSFALRQMLSERIANPVVIVDELDKAASENEQHGRVVDALLAMLEPRTAAAWPDPFLFTPADLSGVTWIMVVNEPERLPATLRSRLKHIPIRPPTSAHAERLIQMTLLELVKGDVHALEKLPAIEPLARKELAEDLQRHGDIRRLKRAVLAAVSAGEWPSVH